MEKFASVKNCKKCNAVVLTSFDDFLGIRKYIPKGYKRIGTREIIIPEHLEVTCPHCGFIWQEECQQ